MFKVYNRQHCWEIGVSVRWACEGRKTGNVYEWKKRGLHTAREKLQDVRSTVNGTISWLDCWPDYFVPEWNMSAKCSMNWHEIGFVQTTMQLIGVTLGQGRWIQMHEAAGRKCSGWGLMRITAIPGTGKHEGTSGRERTAGPRNWANHQEMENKMEDSTLPEQKKAEKYRWGEKKWKY